MKKINRRKTLKFIDILNDWIEQKNDIKIQSKQKYENIINNYLKLSLGNMPITKLSKQDIISFFANLNNKNISLSIKKTCYYIINSSLNYAYNENYCNYFNLKDIRLKSSNKTIFVFSKEQQLIIENELKNNMNIRKICLLLCLYTGLRIGEICGLKWEDINFNKNYIEVKRTIERIKNINGNNTKTILIESTPKSITSNRIIPNKVNEQIYPLSDIKYYKIKGSERKEQYVSGGGSSIKGAVVGGIIAGDTGAIIGSRKGIETTYKDVDDREIIVTLKDGKEVELVDLECYELLLDYIPEKEYDNYIENKKSKGKNQHS